LKKKWKRWKSELVTWILSFTIGSRVSWRSKLAASLISLLSQLKSLGVELKERDGKLACKAPRGALTPDVREQIAKHKEEILCHLVQLSQSRVQSASLTSIERVADLDAYPLSLAQQRWWLMEQLAPGTTLNNLPAAFRFKGPMDRQAFHGALNAIVARHDILRASFRLDGEQSTQIIEREVQVQLPYYDLSEHLLETRAERLDGLFTEAKSRPMDLGQAPLFRAFLVRMSDDEHVFFMMPHHIIWDGWSWDIFLDELNEIYPVLARGETPGSSDLPIQYGDFAVWQEKQMASGEQARQSTYWRNALAGPLPVLELQTDHPRPQQVSHRGDRQPIRIPGQLVNDLRRFGQEEGATIQMVLLSTVTTLLHRYTHQDDILLGTAIQARVRPEVERLIGVFVNTLALRTKPRSDMSFRQLLRHVKEVSLGAFGHQDLPFDRVVEEVNPTRDPSRTPVYQAMFSFQDASYRDTRMGELERSRVDVGTVVAPTDLSVWLMEHGSDIQGGVDYNADLFDAETMERFTGHFYALLESSLADPDEAIGLLPMLTAPEGEQIEAWNNTFVDLPEVTGLHQMIERQAARTPEDLALICGAERVTYGDLNGRANQLARHLQTLGAGTDRMVGIFIERSIDMVVGVLGILKSGSAYLPLDPSYPEDRLSYMLSDSGATLLLTQKHLYNRRPLTDIETVCIDGDWPVISQMTTENVTSVSGIDALAYVIYTSGSTGLPKGVLIPHRAAVNFLASMAKEPGMAADDSIMAVTTLSFDIAVLELYLPLTVGALCHIVPMEISADGQRLAEMLESSSATMIQATPITFRLLTESG
jgi:non-ribosomal peptide synthetase component F